MRCINLAHIRALEDKRVHEAGASLLKRLIGASERFRAVVMIATVATIGMMPAALATGVSTRAAFDGGLFGALRARAAKSARHLSLTGLQLSPFSSARGMELSHCSGVYMGLRGAPAP
jgi:hypothetical protein